MMKGIKTYLLIVALALVSTISYAQGKIYTKKMLIADYAGKTVKVVSGGSSMLEATLREEISTHWRISPFEFCTQQEYDQLCKDNNFYFLQLAQENGIAFLIYSKGGKADESDPLKKPLEVVRIPIANAESPSGTELIFMGAFIDIIQAFTEEASISDAFAYGGLDKWNTRKLTGKRVYVNTDEVEDLYMSEDLDSVVGITITPSEAGKKADCYKMLIATDTHELFYFEKKKYKSEDDARFSDSEIKSFDKRNGIFPR